MSAFVSGSLIIVAVVAVVLVLQKLLDKVFRGDTIKHMFGDATLFENIFQMVLWGIAAIFIGEAVFHVETQNAVATLGIASLYLSQGMQDFIKNLVAGTQIVLGGVLKVGDHIVVGENRGEVMDVN